MIAIADQLPRSGCHSRYPPVRDQRVTITLTKIDLDLVLITPYYANRYVLIAMGNNLVRWTKTVDIFSIDKLFFIININNVQLVALY
jgi:hypothetical protein